MKGVLEFDLPLDSEEFEIAQDGWRYKSVLEDLDKWLRDLSKYKDIESVKVEDARKKIVELNKEYFD